MKEKEHIKRYTQEWIGHVELIPNNGIILLQDSAKGDFLKHQLYRLFLMNKYDGNQTSTFLNHPGYEWIQTDKEKFTIYQKQGNFERNNMDSLARYIEMAMDFNLGFLGITEYPHKLTLFFVGSRNEIQASYQALLQE